MILHTSYLILRIVRILGIETSCDETAVAIVEDGWRVLSSVISSSLGSFAQRGGVIPEYAARAQVEMMVPVLREVFAQSGRDIASIDAVAVTYGPGLLGSLLVGTTTARAIAHLWKKPILPVHHTLGHLVSTWLHAEGAPDISFPILTLSVSGGHTDLWYRQNVVTGHLLATTRDDAAGEAFDKGATLLGLPYPGGPSIGALANRGNELAHLFPEPLKSDSALSFSFSGLKTSLKYLLRDGGSTLSSADVAASYQYAICRHLADRVLRALRANHGIRELHVVGGVSANTRLRRMMTDVVDRSITLRFPEKKYCTDNAAMIASAAYFLHQQSQGRPAPQFVTKATDELASALRT